MNTTGNGGDIKPSLSWARLGLYLLITVAYLKHMDASSPLGISQLNYQIERVFNACSNILMHAPFTNLGVTSWTSFGSNSTRSFYFVQAISYLHYIPALMTGGAEGLQKAMSFLDPLMVIGCSILNAEIYHNFAKNRTYSPVKACISSSLCFTISATSIFSYRMILSMWHDVISLFFILASVLFFLNYRRNTGIILLTIAFLNQYHWCVLYALFAIPIILINQFRKNSASSSYQDFLPPGLNNNRSNFLLLIPVSIPLLIIFLQKVGLELYGFSSSNSSALYRIGIDSINNIHHGGIMGSFQFLGGIRVSLCLQNNFLDSLRSNITDSFLTSSIYNLNQIFTFNCILAIIGSILISLTSIVGFIILAKKEPHTRWFSLPVLYSLISTYFLLQQSTSAHLQGRSILFIIIMGQGICYLIFDSNISVFSRSFYSKASSIRYIFGIPICLGIAFNSIRLSFLLGLNG